MHLLLALLSSILYVVAALFLKQAASRGIDPWRTSLICNLATAALFFTLWPLGGNILGVEDWYQPVLVGLLFVVGQVCGLLALQRGDVSVATPVMGSKVILVAFFTTVILRVPVRMELWLAALLSCAGIAFLNRAGSTAHHRVLVTIVFAIAAAAGFALFDVLVMSWAPAWGVGRFLPLSLLAATVVSLGFIPFFPRRTPSGDRSVRGPLLLGAAFISLQAIIIVSTLAVFGDATAVNVVYGTRGLWSVLAVWWLGHWFANREREEGIATMRARLIGALLLCGAVVLVFV